MRALNLRLGKPVKVLVLLTALFIAAIAVITVFAPDGSAALYQNSLDALGADAGPGRHP